MNVIWPTSVHPCNQDPISICIKRFNIGYRKFQKKSILFTWGHYIFLRKHGINWQLHLNKVIWNDANMVRQPLTWNKRVEDVSDNIIHIKSVPLKRIASQVETIHWSQCGEWHLLALPENTPSGFARSGHQTRNPWRAKLIGLFLDSKDSINIMVRFNCGTGGEWCVSGWIRSRSDRLSRFARVPKMMRGCQATFGQSALSDPGPLIPTADHSRNTTSSYNLLYI